MAISVLGNVTYINQNAQNATSPVRADLATLDIDEFVKKNDVDEVKMPHEADKSSLDPNRRGKGEERREGQNSGEKANAKGESELKSERILDILA